MTGRLVVGLTGGIGAGKSTVAAMLGELGAHVIDVDAIGRAVLEPGGGAYDGVVDTFGAQILADDERIDRARLAAEVFGPADRLDELEAISHPAINARLDEIVAGAEADIVVLDMAVLAESQLGRHDGVPMYRRVVVVEAEMAERLARLEGRGMSREQARERMAAQASDGERRRLADVVVSNNGSIDEVQAFVTALWPTLEAWSTQ